MTRKVYTPRPYAALANEHFMKGPRRALFAGMGTGKTVMVLTWLDFLWNDMGDHRKTLVLGPLRVAKNVWPAQAEEWAHLTRLKVVSITGTVEERRAALRQDAQVYSINYDNLVWLIKELGDDWPFKRVVADESTKLKKFRVKQGGKRAAALGQLAWPRRDGRTFIEEFIELTGTPSPNGLKDLWGQMWFLDRGHRLGLSYEGFESRWFGWRRVKDAITHKPGIEPVIFEHSQEQIQEAIADLCLTIDPKDWFDLKDPIINTINVELPPQARVHYREMERDLFTVLKTGENVEAPHAAAKVQKCLQCANGAMYLEDGVTWREIHQAKIEALESVIEEAAGAPVLVAYNFKSDLARLQKAFPQGRVLDSKKSTEDAWNAGKIPVLFAHPASAGHGLSLQHGGNIIAFFGVNWNLEEHDQIIERIGPTRQAQSGYDRAVFVHYILAANTVDHVVMARLRGKGEVQQLLLDYMKSKIQNPMPQT